MKTSAGLQPTNFFFSATLLPVELLLNRLLASDPFSQQQLASFAGKILHIESTRPAFNVFVTFQRTGLKLSTVGEQRCDATVSAKADYLLQLLFNGQEQLPLANPNLQVSGDAIFVQEVYRIIAAMEINWQDPLSLVIGDTATWQLESGARNLWQWSQTTASAVRNNIDDYLHEEIRLSPSALELDAHIARLEELRLRVDRVQARTALLAQRLTGA